MWPNLAINYEKSACHVFFFCILNFMTQCDIQMRVPVSQNQQLYLSHSIATLVSLGNLDGCKGMCGCWCVQWFLSVFLKWSSHCPICRFLQDTIAAPGPLGLPSCSCRHSLGGLGKQITWMKFSGLKLNHSQRSESSGCGHRNEGTIARHLVSCV